MLRPPRPRPGTTHALAALGVLAVATVGCGGGDAAPETPPPITATPSPAAAATAGIPAAVAAETTPAAAGAQGAGGEVPVYRGQVIDVVSRVGREIGNLPAAAGPGDAGADFGSAQRGFDAAGQQLATAVDDLTAITPPRAFRRRHAALIDAVQSLRTSMDRAAGAAGARDPAAVTRAVRRFAAATRRLVAVSAAIDR